MYLQVVFRLKEKRFYNLKLFQDASQFYFYCGTIYNDKK